MNTTVPSRRSIVIAAIVIFTLTIVLRVPACYESFWLDELHSAWCVWDSLGDVVPRAVIGHQSPFYFVGIWCWKQIVGNSELALRMSSVLAVATSSVVLTFGVARWTNSIAAGMTAGCVIALESNSIFFGTELRPYALVVLCSSVSLICFLRLIPKASRHEDRPAWIGVIVAILLAMLCQPTAIGVLVWLLLALLLAWTIRDHRQLLKFNVADGFLMLGVAVVGFALWRLTLGETWQQRSNWASFATATRIAEIWEVWDWIWLLVVPISLILLAAFTAKVRNTSPSIRQISFTTLLLGLIAVLATSLYWVISQADWIPLWHRRYFVAVLPFFACVAGGAIGVLETALRPSRKSGIVSAVAASVLVLALPYQQGTLARLPDYPVALVTRGEDWRAAIGWVRANSEPDDLVFVDAGLVEANAWLAPCCMTVTNHPSVPMTEQQRKYLAFAVNGPYDANRDVVPIDDSFLEPQWWAGSLLEFCTGRVFVITRQPANRVNVSILRDSRVFGFQNVSVVVKRAQWIEPTE